MTKLQPSYIIDSPWDSIDKKISREQTIINIYKEYFNSQSIPEDKQYWTLCGSHYNKFGSPIKGEYGHLIESGLIKSHQFYGVDREKEIIEKNLEVYPELNWLHGDLLDWMEKYSICGLFKPTIINIDSVFQPKKGTRYLKSIMSFLDYTCNDELLLICNLILKNPYKAIDNLQYSIHDALKMISDIYYVPDHWSVIPKGYVYSGISNHAKMGTLMFLKEKHNIDKLFKVTKNRKI